MERAASSSPSVYPSSFHNWRLGGLYARNPLQILGFSKQGKLFLRGAQASCVASCIHHCKLFEKRENSQRGATETILVNSFPSYLLAKFLPSSWPTSELKPNVSKFRWVLVIVKTVFSCRQEGAAGDLLIQAAICGYYFRLITVSAETRLGKPHSVQVIGNRTWHKHLLKFSTGL